MEFFDGLVVEFKVDELNDVEMADVPAEKETPQETTDGETPAETTESDAERFSSKKSNLSNYRKAAIRAQGPPCTAQNSTSTRYTDRAKSITAFEQYNQTWESIPSHQALHPVPGLKVMHMSHGNAYSWITAAAHPTKVNLIKTTAMHFYLYEVDAEIDESSRQYVKIKDSEDISKVEKLTKFLRRTELPRWHPDRLNMRTGRPGVVDETIGMTDDVVAIRTAIQQLIQACEKFLVAVSSAG